MTARKLAVPVAALALAVLGRCAAPQDPPSPPPATPADRAAPGAWELHLVRYLDTEGRAALADLGDDRVAGPHDRVAGHELSEHMTEDVLARRPESGADVTLQVPYTGGHGVAGSAVRTVTIGWIAPRLLGPPTTAEAGGRR